MKKKLTLLIMAAGMGSRFGGLKQIEPIGPNGEFIIDYSIYDAIKEGFDRVVFIIKEENYEVFRETIGKRIEKQNIEVDYVFQKLTDIPEKYHDLTKRIKPWGTGQAIYEAHDKISENFAVMNSDDFYGRDGIKVIADYLKNLDDDTFAIVGYQANNTLTENGSVKRGVCECNNGYLTKLIECNIRKENDQIIAKSLAENKTINVDKNTLVSMNLFGFTPKVFGILEKYFDKFLEENVNDYENCEFLIPDVLYQAITEGIIKVKVLNTEAKWYGVTYYEDKEEVVEAIKKMIDNGEYPKNLWD